MLDLSDSVEVAFGVVRGDGRFAERVVWPRRAVLGSAAHAVRLCFEEVDDAPPQMETGPEPLGHPVRRKAAKLTTGFGCLTPFPVPWRSTSC